MEEPEEKADSLTKDRATVCKGGKSNEKPVSHSKKSANGKDRKGKENGDAAEYMERVKEELGRGEEEKQESATEKESKEKQPNQIPESKRKEPPGKGEGDENCESNTKETQDQKNQSTKPLEEGENKITEEFKRDIPFDVHDNASYNHDSLVGTGVYHDNNKGVKKTKEKSSKSQQQ